MRDAKTKELFGMSCLEFLAPITNSPDTDGEIKSKKIFFIDQPHHNYECNSAKIYQLEVQYVHVLLYYSDAPPKRYSCFDKVYHRLWYTLYNHQSSGISLELHS